MWGGSVEGALGALSICEGVFWGLCESGASLCSMGGCVCHGVGLYLCLCL